MPALDLLSFLVQRSGIVIKKLTGCICTLQAIREGVTKAQHDLSAASSDRAKAEAQIALECYEALQKAVEGH